VEPQAFVFPHFDKGDKPNFAAHLSAGEHNESVRQCAAWLNLCSDPDELQLYTSTSLRRGNGATIEKEVQRVRAFGQQQCGWGAGSKVPEKHYTPLKAKFQPRPHASSVCVCVCVCVCVQVCVILVSV
jgi:hypothetical protein